MKSSQPTVDLLKLRIYLSKLPATTNLAMLPVIVPVARLPKVLFVWAN